MGVYSLGDGLWSMAEELLKHERVTATFAHPGSERVPSIMTVMVCVEILLDGLS